MLNNLFSKTLRDQRFAVFAGSAGIIALSIYISYIYPFLSRAKEILKLLDQMPPFIKNMINPDVFATPEGFFNLQPFSILAPIIFLAFAIARGSDIIAGDEERGTLDLLLANPLSRYKVLLQKHLATGLVFLIMAAALWAGMAAGCWAFAIPINRLRLLEAVCSCFLLALTFFSLSLAVGCLTGRKRASVAGVSAFAVLAYLIHTYAPMVDSLRPFQKFSPFYYYNGNSVMLNGLKVSHVAIQAALVIVFTCLSLFFFQRRDLRV